MTRPRTHFGANPPGRLAGVMVRAMTAEISDPGRYRRARDYARDGAVTDIVVAEGVIRVEVLGSRADAYVAEIHAGPVDVNDLAATSGASVSTALLIPHRSDVWATCTCPDDGNTRLCKHAVAGLLTFADEVTVEPELLERWRGLDRDELEAASARGGDLVPRDPSPVRRRRAPLAPTSASADQSGDAVTVDVAFTAPQPIPEIGRVAPLDPPRPRHTDDVVVEILADALATLRHTH